jgi:MFS family permease
MNDKLPRAFWILWAGSFINRLGTFVVPFLVIFLSDRGFTFTEAGRIASLMGLGSVLAGLVGGTLTDKVGRRFTLMLGLCLGAFFLLCLLYARATWAIAVIAFCFGLGSDIFRPAIQAAVSDLVPPALRPRAYGLNYWAVNFGFALALPLGGALASGGYTQLFYADAATNLFFAALIFWGVHETRPREAIERAQSSSLKKEPQDFRAALKDRTFLIFCCLVVLASLCLMQTLSSLPLAMRSQGIETAMYGKLLAINGLLIVFLQPFAERVFGKLRPAPRLAMAVSVMGFGMGLQAFCTLPIHYAIAITVWTLGEIALAGFANSVVAHLAPVHLRGAYQGVHGMGWSSGVLLAPLLGPPLLELGGPLLLWLSCAGVAFLGAAGLMWLGPRLERAGTEL